MSKGLEALKRNRNFIERYFVKQFEETGVYHKDMKDEMLNDLSIIEEELKLLAIIKENLKYDYVFIGYNKDNEPLFRFADTLVYHIIKK